VRQQTRERHADAEGSKGGDAAAGDRRPDGVAGHARAHSVGEALAIGRELAVGQAGELVGGRESAPQHRGTARPGGRADDHRGVAGIPAGGVEQRGQDAAVKGGGGGTAGGQDEREGWHVPMFARGRSPVLVGVIPIGC
jgi:hypothetical protein